MKFRDIPQFTKGGSYEVNIPLQFLEKNINSFVDEGLQLVPDFQRGRVWTEDQQIAFVEYFFRGGESGRVIYFNDPNWSYPDPNSDYKDFVLVDGLQKIFE